MRHIDHVVVAVRDLDRAAELYGLLGFQVGARNRHPWGTDNRIIQFRSSFIELITISDNAKQMVPHQQRHFSFGAFVRDFLARRDGLAMLALSSADAASDAALFAKRGISEYEPFSFQREARRPDGATTRVGFTLAFAQDQSASEAGFFVCQQHYPENFWDRSFQQHLNLAADISAVTLTAADPKRHEEFLTRFSGASPRSWAGAGIRFDLEGGRIEIHSALEARTQPIPATQWTSFAVRVDAMESVAHRLAVEGIPFRERDGAMIPAPDLLGNVELRFETNTPV